MAGYSIELDLRGKTAVVVGLGAVGRRKAAGLVEAGARVIGVDPAWKEVVDPGFAVLIEHYRDAHLSGASLVYASAIPDVNERVVLDAKARGIWVNSASDPSAGDFTLPATWRDGPLALTVSTSGASPLLAKTLRDRAVAALGREATGFVAVLHELRPEILARISDPEARRKALSEAADARWLDHFAKKGEVATRRALRRFLGLD